MNQLQLKASSPSTSAWVSASAGTGKTKILTDRVLRLLLSGVPPQKILCLTFTNAAANEMQERIRLKLEELSNASEENLTELIIGITGQAPTKLEQTKARFLYQNYLGQEEQINIHTLHSYCQKILQQFPLEADVTPSFQILDEASSFEAIEKIKRHLQMNPAYEALNMFLAEHFHQLTIDELFKDILAQRLKFSNENITEDDLEKLIAKFSQPCQKKYHELLNYPLICNLVDANPTPARLKKFFLNKDGSYKKRIVSAKTAKPGSALYDELLILQEHVYQLDQEDRHNNAENYTNILKLLARDFIRKYEEYKKIEGYLDYDDLILKTRKLLCDEEARNWVLYKLDGGIDHLLVDEAQDTSPDQWLIIDALIQEFYAGESDSDRDQRTIFVVGDEKQSIFSFQGADIESFIKMNRTLARKLKDAQSAFQDIQLDISYRSAPEILDLVYDLFKSLPEGSFVDLPDINAHRSNHPGKVELWPLVENPDDKDEFWPISENSAKDASSSPKLELSRNIASFIKAEIDSEKIVAATGQPVSPGDFMILFRTRSELTNIVIEELKNCHIPVSGLDRVILSDELIVKDLIAMAQFAVDPDNDLNLACLLRSPFISMPEVEMNDCILSDTDRALREKIDHPLLDSIEVLYRQNSVGNFFLELQKILNLRAVTPSYYEKSALESLDELLGIVESYSRNYDGSLHGFLNWFAKSEKEIKKEAGMQGQVKIMTLHGSKGLQSPYVILCDTTSVPSNKDRFLWCDTRGAVSVRTSSFAPDYYHDLKNEAKKLEYREYLRLLYVGMTRAEDHLVIAGYQGKKSLPENCWYRLAEESMHRIGQKDNERYIVESKGKVTPNSTSKLKPETSREKIIMTLANNPVQAPQLNATNEKTVLSPLIQNQSLEYGLVFHKVLEDSIRLSSLGEMKWHPLIETLSSKEQKRMLNSINQIISNEQFLELLKFDTKTELSVGISTEKYKIGRIDLVIDDGTNLHIIDYKSDIKPPVQGKEVPEKYITQLEFYRSTLREIYPNHQISCYILWLETGELTKCEVPNYDSKTISIASSPATSS